MKSKFLILALLALMAAGLIGCDGIVADSAAESLTKGASAPAAAATPLAPPPHAKHVLYDPALPPASAEPVKEVTLHVKDVVSEVAPDVPVDLWTFGDTAPGPVIHVNLGDTVKFTLVNDGTMEHSIDFHAAQTPPNKNYISVKPGASYSFEWKANYPGVFMYHCGTPPVIHHIANGMYGAIVVTPPDLKPVGKEYVLVQSEFYLKQGPDGMFHTDGTKANAATPDYVVFNGYANQYKDSPLTADPGERIRLWVVNAGPSTFSAFHVIGAIFDAAYADGNPANAQHGMQTVTVPPGGGYMVELTIPQPGLYAFVTHSFAYTGKGALGIIKVGDGGSAMGADTNMANMQH